MAFWKQAVLCLVVLAIAAGGWFTFEHFQNRPDAGQAASSQGGGTAGGSRRQGGANFGPTLVVTNPVTSDIITDPVRAVGTVSVPRSINLYPQASAPVTEVLFKAGDKVAVGQPLVRLDDADQKVALDLANVSLQDAKKALDRSQKLAASNNIAVSALEDAQSVYQKAQIAVQSAKIALDRRTIAAPFPGVVGLSTIAVGDLLTTSTVVTTLDDISQLKVTFLIPERFSGQATIGQPITATTDSKPDAPIEGKLSAVDSRVDSLARTLKVEALLDPEAAQQVGVRPGMSIKVALDFPGEKQLAVSSLAIQWDRTGSYVWKLDGDSVKRASVDILERQSGRVLVSSDDLTDQDKVIVEGLQRLRDGVKIAELGNATPAAAEGTPTAAAAPMAGG